MSFVCSHLIAFLWFVTFLGIFGMIFAVLVMRAGYKAYGLIILGIYMTAFAARPMIVRALTPSCSVNLPYIATPLAHKP